MKFTDRIVPLGEGKLICAAADGDAVELYVSSGGEIKKRVYSRKAKRLGAATAVSFAAYYFPLCGGYAVERGDGFTFVEKN